MTNKIFYFAQYGFWYEHSTAFVVLYVVDRIIIIMDSIKTLIGIFVWSLENILYC